jgi:long-chain acyl-CoA synthetase
MAGGLRDFAQTEPDAAALTAERAELTREALNARVNQCISLFGELGAPAGGSIAIMAANGVDYVVIALAAALSGRSLVPVNWRLKPTEISYILAHTRAGLMFIDPGEPESAAEEAARLSGGSRIVRLDQEFADLLAGQPAIEPADDLCFGSPVFFTSGTTGRPKATQLSQNPKGIPVREALEQIGRNALLSGISSDCVHLVQGPLYHAGPLGNAVNSLLVGGRVHIMTAFDPVEALRCIEQRRVTHTMMVPTMFIRLLRLPEETRRGFDVSSLKVVTHLAAPMPPETKRQMIDWWGPILTDAYGCSEIGVITKISSEEWLARPGSVGRPIPSFTLQIIGEDGEELPPGEIGTIYATSLTDVDLVYLDDPERTAAAHRAPKQFTVGDMGWLDAEGYLYLADRRVDMINSGGVNIYPAEIEAELIAHPAVEDVCVVGAPNEEWGQEVRAAIKLRPGRQASPELEADILSWLSARIAKYKVPRSIEFLAELPRHPNGKLHRREVRERYWTATPIQAGAARA